MTHVSSIGTSKEGTFSLRWFSEARFRRLGIRLHINMYKRYRDVASQNVQRERKSNAAGNVETICVCLLTNIEISFLIFNMSATNEKYTQVSRQ